MANLTNPGKRIRITRKERESGQIDKSKIPAQKHIVIRMNKPEKPEPAQLEHKHGAEKREYKKADVRTGHPSYGKESKKKDTPDFIKKAQQAGADVVHKDGKVYRAGHSTTTKAPDKHSVRIKITPELKMVKKVAIAPKEGGAGKDRIDQGSSKPMKRRLDRVKWLAGRNKKTEAGFGPR